jgi:hypothetical protein
MSCSLTRTGTGRKPRRRWARFAHPLFSRGNHGAPSLQCNRARRIRALHRNYFVAAVPTSPTPTASWLSQ